MIFYITASLRSWFYSLTLVQTDLLAGIEPVKAELDSVTEAKK